MNGIADEPGRGPAEAEARETCRWSEQYVRETCDVARLRSERVCSRARSTGRWRSPLPPAGSVMVAVVQVREVRVTVTERLVDMSMAVRLSGRSSRRMGMLVMRVVDVRVGVRERLVLMLVVMTLGQM